MTESNISFSAKPLFHPVGDRRAQVVTALRDWYYERFKKHISLLLEQKRSRKVSSSKGRLNPRALHKYRFSDNIFQKHITTNSSDTTIVFLIDGSGSMSSTNSTPVGDVEAVGICGAVASAFAKANMTVLKNKIPVEVFVKSAPTTWGPSLTGTENGGMVCLSRVFSSNKRSMDFDRLLRLTTSSPISCEGGNVGSYTSEYAILPALNKWIRKNVKTKKCIVFNLTDGEAYCTLGTDQYQFRSEDTKAMRLKYLRGIPNLTLMLGSYGRGMGRMKDIYGDNMVMAEDDFSGSLFRAFAGFLA
jgi:hypothetical protein